MEPPDNAACSSEMYVAMTIEYLSCVHFQWGYHSLSTLSFVHSYKMVMQQCWLSDPDQRPKFSQLRAEIDGVLTTMSGYLDFSAIAPCVDMDKVNVYMCFVMLLSQKVAQ